MSEFHVGDEVYITGVSSGHHLKIGRKVYIFHDERDGSYGVSVFPYHDTFDWVAADDLGVAPPEPEPVNLIVESGDYLPW